MGPSFPDVLSNPFVVGAAVLLLVLTYLSRASEKLHAILGPFGKWLGERQLRKIRRRGELGDARVEYLERQVSFLLDEVSCIRSEQQQQWSLLRTHQRWDDKVARQVRELGGEVEDPPPLYPSKAA